jgi:hypothetical protein
VVFQKSKSKSFLRWCLGEPFGFAVGPFWRKKREGRIWWKVVVGWKPLL